MGFTKTKDELGKYYALSAREFPGAKMLGAIFQTTEAIVERLLPPPLQPDDMPNGLIFIAEYPETNLGPGYLEGALFLKCKYEGESGNYCLGMSLHGQEVRIYNGREIFGYPKKMAKIHLERKGDSVHGWIERQGVRLVEVKAKLAASMPQLPPMGPNFLFKGMPRIDLQPGFDGPVLLCRQQTDVALQSLEIGSAEINLRPSDADPWAEVEITNVIMGFYLVSNNTMQPGKVLTEVDGKGFLPYFFKMTDFFAGK